MKAARNFVMTLLLVAVYFVTVTGSHAQVNTDCTGTQQACSQVCYNAWAAGIAACGNDTACQSYMATFYGSCNGNCFCHYVSCECNYHGQMCPVSMWGC